MCFLGTSCQLSVWKYHTSKNSVKSSQIWVILGTRNRIFGSLRRDKLKITEYSFVLSKVTTRPNPNPVPNGPGTGLVAKKKKRKRKEKHDAEHRSTDSTYDGSIWYTAKTLCWGQSYKRGFVCGLLFVVVICHTCISNYSICKQIIDDSFVFFESDLWSTRRLVHMQIFEPKCI